LALGLHSLGPSAQADVRIENGMQEAETRRSRGFPGFLPGES